MVFPHMYASGYRGTERGQNVGIVFLNSKLKLLSISYQSTQLARFFEPSNRFAATGYQSILRYRALSLPSCVISDNIQANKSELKMRMI